MGGSTFQGEPSSGSCLVLGMEEKRGGWTQGARAERGSAKTVEKEVEESGRGSSEGAEEAGICNGTLDIESDFNSHLEKNEGAISPGARLEDTPRLGMERSKTRNKGQGTK